jgi:hypothetical protein
VKILLVCLAILGAQVVSLQDKPVVQLPPQRNSITVDFGGRMVQLIHAPTVISLPDPPPIVDKEGNPWAVDAKNLGPGRVRIVGKHAFTVLVNVGQTVHIHSDGVAYSLER